MDNLTDREFDSDGMRGRATFSPCERYRYTLSRLWGPGRILPVLMLNPSTATEAILDPTITRVIGFAKRAGFDGIVVGNIFAFRATDPKVMMGAADPIGPANDMVIRNLMMHAKVNRHHLLCGWGANGGHLGRSAAIKEMINVTDVDAICLGKTKAGQPKHPLYIASDQPFEPWG